MRDGGYPLGEAQQNGEIRDPNDNLQSVSAWSCRKFGTPGRIREDTGSGEGLLRRKVVPDTLRCPEADGGVPCPVAIALSDEL